MYERPLVGEGLDAMGGTPKTDRSVVSAPT